MKFIWSLLIVGVLGSSQALAGLHLEPYAGIGKAAYKIDVDGFSAVDPDDDDTSSIGARIGYSFLLLSAGIDYEMLTADDNKATNLAAFVGVDFPILVRGWAKFYLSSDFDEADDTDVTFKDGYAVGLGFTGLPFVSLNIELQTLNYEVDFGIADGDYSVAHTLFSVSLPL